MKAPSFQNPGGVNMFIFGIDIPILELLVLFSVVVVIYLIILEFEFRQLRTITR